MKPGRKTSIIILLTMVILIGWWWLRSSTAEVQNCRDENCFQTNFLDCQRAVLTDRVAGQPAEMKILGPAETGCRIELVFLNHHSQDWINQPLTCQLDNDQHFRLAIESALENIFNNHPADCSGDLYRHLTQ